MFWYLVQSRTLESVAKHTKDHLLFGLEGDAIVLSEALREIKRAVKSASAEQNPGMLPYRIRLWLDSGHVNH